MQNSMPFQIFQRSKFRQNGAYDYIALTQWRSQGAEGQLRPLAETLSPSRSPNEITRCTEIYGESPI